ncbi:MAG: phosphatidate cytidylyltransferase [Pseudomonadota bacterium]
MLAKRVLSALVALALVLSAIFLMPNIGTFAVLIAIVAMAAWEWGTLMTSRRSPFAIGYALVAAGVFVAIWWLSADVSGGRHAILWLALAFWLAAFVVILRFPVTFGSPVVFVAGLTILVPAFVALAFVFDGPQGDYRLLMLLGVIWAADVGAYFFGRRFGSVKLAPRVSPGKSWEGVFGGLLTSAAVGAFGAWYLGLPILPVTLLSAATAAVSVIGDLTVSMFKRNAGVKDSGTLFPGHGGLLDRVDSICAGAPLFAIALPALAG